MKHTPQELQDDRQFSVPANRGRGRRGVHFQEEHPTAFGTRTDLPPRRLRQQEGSRSRPSGSRVTTGLTAQPSGHPLSAGRATTARPEPSQRLPRRRQRPACTQEAPGPPSAPRVSLTPPRSRRPSASADRSPGPAQASPWNTGRGPVNGPAGRPLAHPSTRHARSPLETRGNKQFGGLVAAITGSRRGAVADKGGNARAETNLGHQPASEAAATGISGTDKVTERLE